MRVLLDENLPGSLGKFLVGHEVSTVARMGWRGTKNGALLKKAADSGFEVLLTLDDDMEAEQNISGLALAILVLKPTRQGRSYVIELVPNVLAALEVVEPGMISSVEPG